MKHTFSRLTFVSTVVALLMAMTGAGCLSALAANVERPVDYLYERSMLRGNSVPTSTTNLSDRADEKYTAQWTKIYEYTYTNYRMCTGDSTKRFKVYLDAHCYGDSSENPPGNGTITVEVYNNSGARVTSWSSSSSTAPKFTAYYTPSSSTAYYYFKIKLSNCAGYSAGKLTVSLADK